MLLRWYKSAALIIFNALIILGLINLLCLIILALLPPPADSLKDIYSFAHLKSAYPQYTAEEMDALLSESHGRGFVYDPYLGYREAPYSGRYVNVTQSGYRQNGTIDLSPDDSTVSPVFIFGGSTTFGYGVADTNTIAAFLDKMLKEKNPASRVYNFGAGGYFSEQEVIWFKRILATRHAGVTAIFLDGLNEFSIRGDDPLFAGSIRQLLGTMQLSQDLKDKSSLTDRFMAAMPVMKLYHARTRRTNVASPRAEKVNTEELQRLIIRYKTNCKTENAIAGLYGIHPLFVVQPVPQYDYDLNYHLFKADPRLYDPYVKAGYAEMKAICADSSFSWLWLGELQHGIKKNLYVDNVHYNPEMNRMIATAIFEKLTQ